MLIGVDANEANRRQRVGSNQFAFKILWQLYRQDKNNHYLVYLKQAPLQDLPRPRENWHYLVLRPGFFWTQWRLPLALFLGSLRPRIFLSLGHYAPRFSPVPTLICIMDLAFLKFPKQFLKQDLYKLRIWTRRSAQNASHVFTISQHSKKDIIKHYQLTPSKITVVYPGIESPWFVSSRLPQASEYLLYLGTLQPRKNLFNLIKAYASLPAPYSRLQLVIAGKKGWLYHDLYQLVHALQLKKRVRFTGFVKNKQLPQLIRQARLFILPSFYEGFGIPVLQAMASQTLVLVSRNSSLKEIVKTTGVYIEAPFGAEEIKQGIIRALSLPEAKQEQLLSQAQKRARLFSWEKAAQKILGVINELAL
jgi:glycosyltransferase involved in cell wall biosynthesis